MRSIDATITSRGQVTIPAEIRRVLGVRNGDTVTFHIEDIGVRIIPARYTLESAFGSIPAISGMSADFDDEIEEAMRAEIDRS